MFEYWTPLGHFIALAISFLFAATFTKGKIFSKKGILTFIITLILSYLAMGLWA